jgi:hypothetical protein
MPAGRDGAGERRCDTVCMATLSTGYRGNPDWRDMSEYAVHFTKASATTSAYDVMLKILGEGQIEPTGPLGAARNLTELGDSQKSACFSEIPLDLLARVIARRSLYGIGFRQDFLINHGGARVWYLDKDGSASAAFQEAVRAAMTGGIDPADPVWRITPLIDYPGDYGGTQYRFEWEREWRVPGGLAFGPDDVAFLFIPEEWHGAARSFFEGHLAENTGPAHLCPYVDPRWDTARIQAAFAAVAAPPIVVTQTVDEDICDYCGGPVASGQCLLCGEPSLR